MIFSCNVISAYSCLYSLVEYIFVKFVPILFVISTSSMLILDQRTMQIKYRYEQTYASASGPPPRNFYFKTKKDAFLKPFYPFF